MRARSAFVLTGLITVVITILPAVVSAQNGRVTVTTPGPFVRVTEALERAITEEKMALVCHANAQRGAAARGVTIKGNQVLMVFRNDFAVRLLAADPTAGFEAPIRIYVYENPDGTATLSYVPPSMLFALYQNAEVQAVARELDAIFKTIVERGMAGR
jgi:uncharacterized protein (DUF302 family)